MMACISCGRGLHDECFFPGMYSLSNLEENSTKCCCSVGKKEESIPFSSTGGDNPRVGRPPKPDSEITTSAGRKRAAVAYEIIPEKPCEWKWLKNCGGGKYPIVGCLNGFQQHRHHGPVKDTSRNEPQNVHRICTACHNRYHTLNDDSYEEAVAETLPHSPLPATLEEIAGNDFEWREGRYSKKILEQSPD
jgi:hypothetical protein